MLNNTLYTKIITVVIWTWYIVIFLHNNNAKMKEISKSNWFILIFFLHHYQNLQSPSECQSSRNNNTEQFKNALCETNTNHLPVQYVIANVIALYDNSKNQKLVYHTKCLQYWPLILWNLSEVNASNYVLDETSRIKCIEGHVFISYQWASKPIVFKVWERLKRMGYRVWIDEENMCKFNVSLYEV